jgi:CelD/BcsL family acetyltransferase involved in cellulose biosynthesis
MARRMLNERHYGSVESQNGTEKVNSVIAPRLNYTSYRGEPLSLHANDELIVTVETELFGIRAAWRELEARAAGHVYQSFNWVSLWYASVGSRHEITPHIAAGWGADGRLLFLLPLGMCRKAGARMLIWLGGREADINAGLFDSDFLDGLADAEWEELWQRVLAQMPKIDAIHLDNQPEFIAGRRNPLAAAGTHLLPDRTHATRLSADWDQFYKSRRSSNARNLEKRRMRQLQSAGEVKFEVVKDTTDAIPLLERLLDEKAQALGTMGVADPFAGEGVRQFLLQQTRRLFPRGTAHLSMLTVDGKPVSMTWGHVFNKRFYYLISVYDPAYSRAAPGRLHLRELLRWSVENGIETFDMGVGDQDYKFHWCEEHTGLFATIEGRTLRGRPIAALLSAKTSLKRRIKTSKTLWPAVQTLRAQLAALARKNR